MRIKKSLPGGKSSLGKTTRRTGGRQISRYHKAGFPWLCRRKSSAQSPVMSNQPQQQATLTLAQQDMLTDLKHANRTIALTNIGYRVDLMRYLRSNNETIRREYNRLRVLLVEMIRSPLSSPSWRESNTGSALDAFFRDVQKKRPPNCRGRHSRTARKSPLRWAPTSSRKSAALKRLRWSG